MGLLINENEFTSKSTSPKLIGETFTTLRTGIIDGAVEQDGSQYNSSDYPEIETLLNNGDLPYITINEFDSMVFNQGGCNSFGWYNNDSSQLKWWVWDEITESGNNFLYTLSPEPQVGDLGLNFYGLDENISYTDKLQDYNERKKTEKITFVGNAPEGTVSDGTDISGRYCVIANGTFFVFSTYNQTKEKPAYDFTSTYFKVPKKLSRVLVRTQKPTYSNNYTYFNVYADGWVEQGGKITLNGVISDNNKNISLPVEMASSKYYNIVSQDANAGGTPRVTVGWQSTTKMTVGFVSTGGVNGQVSWEVKGYADSTEYTKDKWNYQNVNYERHMIQLK